MREIGIRVSRNTHAPLTLPGTLSTAGHWDQSSVPAAIYPHYRTPDTLSRQRIWIALALHHADQRHRQHTERHQQPDPCAQRGCLGDESDGRGTHKEAEVSQTA